MSSEIPQDPLMKAALAASKSRLELAKRMNSDDNTPGAVQFQRTSPKEEQSELRLSSKHYPIMITNGDGSELHLEWEGDKLVLKGDADIDDAAKRLMQYVAGHMTDFIARERATAAREASIAELQDALSLWSNGEAKQHMIDRIAALQSEQERTEQ